MEALAKEAGVVHADIARQLLLGEVAPKLTPPTSYQAGHNGKRNEFRLFSDWWLERYQEETGTPYIENWAKDATLIHPLLRMLGLEELMSRADRFLCCTAQQDEFIASTDRSLGVFRSVANKPHIRGDVNAAIPKGLEGMAAYLKNKEQH
jgi:hypothetical protein